MTGLKPRASSRSATASTANAGAVGEPSGGSHLQDLTPLTSTTQLPSANTVAWRTTLSPNGATQHLSACPHGAVYTHTPVVMATVDLVVARYSEDLSWLDGVPPTISTIWVYDKAASGPAARAPRPSRGSLFASRTMRRRMCAVGPTHEAASGPTAETVIPASAASRTRVVPLPNVGREADTYLHHILARYDDLADVVVFCQGNPLDHCPQFLELLAGAPDGFRRPVQPLADRWKVDMDVPPQKLLDGLPPAHAHPISCFTLQPLRFHDPGAVCIWEKALEALGASNGDNLVKTLLSRCGAERAAQACHDATSVCWGAAFGVTRDALRALAPSTYEALRRFNGEHQVGPYLLERSWMALWGFQPRPDETIR